MRVLLARYQNLDEHLADLSIEEEENGDSIFDEEVEEQVNRYELCLITIFYREEYNDNEVSKCLETNDGN